MHVLLISYVSELARVTLSLESVQVPYIGARLWFHTTNIGLRHVGVIQFGQVRIEDKHHKDMPLKRSYVFNFTCDLLTTLHASINTIGRTYVLFNYGTNKHTLYIAMLNYRRLDIQSMFYFYFYFVDGSLDIFQCGISLLFESHWQKMENMKYDLNNTHTP